MSKIGFLLCVLLATLFIAIPVASCTGGPYIYVDNYQVTPSPILEGESATLMWQVSGASEVEIDNSVGVVAPYGKLQIKPVKTTTYILTAKNMNRSVQEKVTIVVNHSSLPDVTKVEIPTISALDTKTLLKNMGKEVRVEGNITYISSWFPSRTTGREDNQRMTFIFFMKDVWEGWGSDTRGGGSNITGLVGQLNEIDRLPEINERWRDLTGYFRAIITQSDIPNFLAYLPVGNPGLLPDGSFQNYRGFIVQEKFPIVLQGVLGSYLSAPALYLTNPAQISTANK